RGQVPNLPLILMTAYPLSLRDQPERTEGFDRVLTKPLNLQELRHAVDAALGRETAVAARRAEPAPQPTPLAPVTTPETAAPRGAPPRGAPTESRPPWRRRPARRRGGAAASPGPGRVFPSPSWLSAWWPAAVPSNSQRRRPPRRGSARRGPSWSRAAGTPSAS